MQRRTLFRAALAAIAAPAVAAAVPKAAPLEEVRKAMEEAWNARPCIVDAGHSHYVTDPGHSHGGIYGASPHNHYVGDPRQLSPVNLQFAAVRCWDTCYAGAPLTWYPT